MILRAATAADAQQVAALWNAMIRDTLATFTTDEMPLQTVLERIAARPFWVAADGPSVQGFVSYGPFRSGPGYAATVEHTVIVAPAAQGAGLGHSLMQQAENAAQSAGHHIMVAAISSANPAAETFHAARGFVRTGHMPQVGRKAGRWLDLILMQKTLARP